MISTRLDGCSSFYHVRVPLVGNLLRGRQYAEARHQSLLTKYRTEGREVRQAGVCALSEVLALTEETGFVPNTHMVTHTHL